MCGITGIFSSDPIHPSLPDTALSAMRHRGPDDSGTYHDSHMALGHVRLSILDTSVRGRQPMELNGTSFRCVFNGEIYNYKELKEELQAKGQQFTTGTDTEVLLAAYQHWGQGCLSRLRGMFAFAIWDPKSGELFLARDRCGEKPLYYWRNDNLFCFASELKSLMPLLPNRPNLNPAAIDQFLHYQYVPEPQTPLQDVWKLPAAHYMILSPKDMNARPQQYWSLEEAPEITGDPAELIREELHRIISLTLRSDVPVGVALSGGIDSGGIAALAAPKYHEVMNAFSVGYPGRPAHDERDEAIALAKKLNLRFHDVELNTETLVNFFPELIKIIDEPIGDIAAFGHYSVAKLAADHGIKVMLSGIGGDELFWGYGWPQKAVSLTQIKQALLQKKWRRLEKLQRLILPPLSRICCFPALSCTAANLLNILEATKYPDEAIFYTLVPDFTDALRITPSVYQSSFVERLQPRNAFAPMSVNLSESKDIPLVICKLLFDTWLSSNCLALGDRVSMASGVETRMPFLDHKLIELVFGLRRHTADHKLGHKPWLKAALKGTLPQEVLDRPKRGFQPPVLKWMKCILQRYENHLLDGLLTQQLFDRDVLHEMLRKKNKDHSTLFMLYKILILELWYASIIVDNPPTTTNRTQ